MGQIPGEWRNRGESPLGGMQALPDDVLAELFRQAGLTARIGANSLGGLGAVFANPLAVIANEGLDAVGSDYRFPDQFEALQGVLNQAGFPEPQGMIEQGVNFAGEMGVPDPSDSARVVSAISHMIDPSMMDNVMQAMTVFHGTPHKWADDRPDMSKIGTGEGAQAYGHGLYFAENQGVAQQYADELSRYGELHFPDGSVEYVPDMPDGARKTAAQLLMRNADAADARYAAGVLDSSQFKGYSADDIRREIDALADAGASNSGNLYELDLPDETIARMLDWDAPLSEQPESVRKALGDDIRTLHLDASSGAKLYNELARVYGSDAEASAAMSELGIPGIKYLDGTSRRAGEGTRNFVVFSDDAVTPLKRNGEALGGLPMDEASRMARAREMGFDTDAYHGSTHDIQAFDGSITNPESDWGRGTYTSTSIDDINANYAGEGPDLTNRIELESERVADELMYEAEYILGEHGIPMSAYEADESAVAHQIARSRLLGDAEGGVVYPLKIRTDKYAVVGGPNTTRIEADDYYDLARSEIDPKDYADEFEFEDAVSERSWELEADDTEGAYARIHDALQETVGGQADGELANAMGQIREILSEEGGIGVDDLDRIIRETFIDVWDYQDELMSAGGVSADVLKNLGFEGVIDNTVNQKFGAGRQYGVGMEGINYDTQHIITFPGFEKNLRSPSAKFDPDKIDSARLDASLLDAMLNAGMV